MDHGNNEDLRKDTNRRDAFILLPQTSEQKSPKRAIFQRTGVQVLLPASLRRLWFESAALLSTHDV